MGALSAGGFLHAVHLYSLEFLDILAGVLKKLPSQEKQKIKK